MHPVDEASEFCWQIGLDFLYNINQFVRKKRGKAVIRYCWKIQISSVLKLGVAPPVMLWRMVGEVGHSSIKSCLPSYLQLHICQFENSKTFHFQFSDLASTANITVLYAPTESILSWSLEKLLPLLQKIRRSCQKENIAKGTSTDPGVSWVL